MATLTYTATYDIWVLDAFAGGTISVSSATSMTYVSNAGYTVTLQGTGLTYDADGLPSGGIVTGLTVVKDSTTYWTLTSISVDFARTGMLLLGYDEHNGGHRGPDPYGFLQLALAGSDLTVGSNGNDNIFGTLGNDTIQAGGGNDYVDAESGSDVMDGGDGFDTLAFDMANSSWTTFRGINLDAATGVVIDNWGHTDSISNFERFQDSLYSDTLKGGAGDEQFVINRGNDLVNGRGGFDWVKYFDVDRWGATRGVTVNLTTGLATDSWGGTDTLFGIEGIEGSQFNDTLIGNGVHNAFYGAEGVDRFEGGAGVDTLIFHWNDYNGTPHGVSVNLALATAIIDDGYGNAEVALSIEEVEGSNLADSLVGNAGANFLWGFDGNDTLNGAGGNDDLGGGWGSDLVIGGLGNDSIGGGGDNDTLTGGGGVDQFYFGWDLPDVGVDRITDFVAGSETIWVGSWWGGGLVNQDLVANQFRSGAGVTTANSSTQRFIYNTSTGALYFDADGNGGGSAAIRFATLTNLAALTYADIDIMF